MTIPVSVVIPTYNGTAYLRQALGSVFAQTLPPLEIVVVDDASTDGTADLVAMLAHESPVPLRLHRLATNSGGPAHPMNVGLELASAELVALLDQDDEMGPRKLEAHADVFARDDSLALVFGQSRRMSETGELGPDRASAYACYTPPDATPLGGTSYRIASPDALRLLLTRGYNYGGAGGTSVSKRAWKALGGFHVDLKICWDYDFAMRSAAAGYAVGYTAEIVHHRRWHGGNLELSGGGDRLRGERLRVLQRVAEHDSLTRELKHLARQAHRSELLGSSYWYRVGNQHDLALDALLNLVRCYGPGTDALVGLAKLGVHFAGRQAVAPIKYLNSKLR